MELLSQLTGLWKKPESPVVPQPPTAPEQRQQLLAQVAVVNDSIVYGGCAASEVSGSSTDIEPTSNPQDVSNDVAPV